MISMRKSLFLAAALTLLVTGAAFAGRTAGQLGLGTSHVMDTPIGIRYWASNQVGIDVEVGFNYYDVETDSGDLKTVFRGQLGIPFNVWECSDVWFHVRPFFMIEALSYEDFNGTSIDGLTNFAFGAQLEMEAWLLECLSFSVWHGVVVQVNDGGSNGDSTTDFMTAGESLGNAGFHLYF